MQAKLLCAQKIHHARDLLKFIRTQTVPPILWKPARQNPDVDTIYNVRTLCVAPLFVCVVYYLKAEQPKTV